MSSIRRGQFGGLLSPEVLLPIAGTFLVMFGAEFVGGAAAVIAVSRLIGFNQLLCDYYFYEPRGTALHWICMSARVTHGPDFGAKLIEEILVQLFTGIATAVGIHMISPVAKRLMSMLMNMLEHAAVQMYKKPRKSTLKSWWSASRMRNGPAGSTAL